MSPLLELRSRRNVSPAGSSSVCAGELERLPPSGVPPHRWTRAEVLRRFGFDESAPVRLGTTRGVESVLAARPEARAPALLLRFDRGGRYLEHFEVLETTPEALRLWDGRLGRTLRYRRSEGDFAELDPRPRPQAAPQAAFLAQLERAVTVPLLFQHLDPLLDWRGPLPSVAELRALHAPLTAGLAGSGAEDGCYARAQLVAARLSERSFGGTFKAFIFPPDAGFAFHATTVCWAQNAGGRVEAWALDAALEHAVPLVRWLSTFGTGPSAVDLVSAAQLRPVEYRGRSPSFADSTRAARLDLELRSTFGR